MKSRMKPKVIKKKITKMKTRMKIKILKSKIQQTSKEKESDFGGSTSKK